MIVEVWERVAAFIEARVAEEEWWAKEASRGHFGEYTPTGEGWIWGDEYGTPVSMDPTLGEHVGEVEDADAFSVCLMSVEKYPCGVGTETQPDSRMVLDAEEVKVTFAGHIVRHDPHKVMRRVESTRRAVGHCTAILVAFKRQSLAEEILADLAAGWDWHPDYGSWLR